MRKRAEQVEQTRQRIIEAAVRLHTTVGPANTTISGLAEEAGVTRLTVYRHFEDEDAIFAACLAHWARQHPPPDPAAWREIADVQRRARHALGELYGWYRDNGDDLVPLYRDVAAMPASTQQGMRDNVQQLTDALVVGWKVRGRARRRLRAAVGHVVSFWTWHSLAVEQGLSDEEAADLAASLLVAATEPSRDVTQKVTSP